MVLKLNFKHQMIIFTVHTQVVFVVVFPPPPKYYVFLEIKMMHKAGFKQCQAGDSQNTIALKPLLSSNEKHGGEEHKTFFIPRETWFEVLRETRKLRNRFCLIMPRAQALCTNVLGEKEPVRQQWQRRGRQKYE